MIPPDVVTTAGAAPNPVRIGRMLDAGAALCAAIELLGPGVGYLLSRGGSGRVIASVVLPTSQAEVTLEGATPALALLAAYSAALLEAVGTGTGAQAPALAGAVVH
ncbi:MAG: hypothetical protein JSS36_09110 [Proteobacteria bacterium]|nr:hypothetical protein [Pseudomonadota bacterium]